MEQNLFASIDNQQEQKVGEKDFYEKVLEKRTRPEIELEATHKIKPEPEVMISDDTGISIGKVSEPEVYPYKLVLEKATEYFNGDALAASVWINKYSLKSGSKEFYELTPDDMHRRLAREIARIEKKYPNPLDEQTIFDLLKDFKYIVPQGGPMAGIGNDFHVSSLSNCFVIGDEGDADSYGGIMKTDQEQVQLMKRRGGVGHDLSHIRPEGSPVKNSAMTSTGIVPFMERFSNSTREVAQGGRRGALMLTISVKHPDAGEFISAKMEQGKVTAANISVRIDDAFMKAVHEQKTYTQQYPIDSPTPVVTKEINARDLWDKIIHNAWKSAEPGVLFWDTIAREAIPDCYADLGFKTVSTNPCGEIPLCPYDSCRLLAINLYSYVKNPFTEEARFDAELFTKHARYGLRIMDDIIDLEVEKIEKILQKIDADPEDQEIKRTERQLWENILKKSTMGRRTGIGITAEGDMLAALGTRYGSEEAINFATEVHKILAIEVYHSSATLAGERGSFPIYDPQKEKDNPFILRLKEAAPRVYELMQKNGRRNMAMLTIAPTGSVSICTQTTSGIEPIFAIRYKRRRKVNPSDQDVNISFVDDMGDAWEEYNVLHPKFEYWLKTQGIDPDEVKDLSGKKMDRVIKKSPYYKATSSDIDWVNKVKMQGSIQKWVDHSISVTVNVPEDITEELVGQVYTTAWESGCKGMTIFREGSREGVLINHDAKKDGATANIFQETSAPKRPKVMDADVLHFQNNDEEWVAVVGLLDNRPYEIFTGRAEGFFLPPWVKKGKVIKNKLNNERSRYDFQYEDDQGYKTTMEGLSRQFNTQFWNYAKLISGILRHGMPLLFAVQLIDNLEFDTRSINNWKNGVARALKKYIPDGTQLTKGKCPECGAIGSMAYKEGCATCDTCGYSQCG